MNTVRCMWCMSVYVYQPTREKKNAFYIHRGPDIHRHARHAPLIVMPERLGVTA